MKKIILFLLVGFLGLQYGKAQNKKIYVSKQGGKPKLLYGFRMGYNSTFYTNNCNKYDTLICQGSGYERAFVDKKVFADATNSARYFTAFNSAIRKTEKHIRKTGTKEGELTFGLKGQNVAVKYKNADAKGNADIEIEVL